jgi:uncharacterized membrane protein
VKGVFYDMKGNLLLSISNNPFIPIINSLTNDLKTWLLAIVGGIDVVLIIITAIKYKGATIEERPRHIKFIRNLLIMSIGIYVLIWIVIELHKVLSGVKY